MMRMLVTGASSPLAVGVLRRLLSKGDVEIWCGRRRKELPLVDPRLRVIDLDHESDLREALSGLAFFLVVHFAGVTHASEEERYWKVNRDATVRLAEAARENGCQRFVYISTRCATRGSGAYGESKLAAEEELRKLEWKSLLIIRPAEVYGAAGAHGTAEADAPRNTEGIDRMLVTARRWRVVPALFGHSNLSFAPLHVDDFSRVAAELIQEHNYGVRIETICGPEDLSALQVAYRIAKRHRALLLILWWPALALFLKALNKLGLGIVKPDQLQRLVSEKTGTAKSAATKPRERFRRFPAN
jgi:nucleoside-diphosphate-sugar epimerase